LSVKLISVTPDAEKTILYVARVSSDQSNDSPGLLRYLIRNKHWSPFEMAHMTLEIITSRAISQQIIRHRSFSFQEFSQRYSPVENFMVYEGRKQAEENRQSSINNLDEELQAWWNYAQEDVIDLAKEVYREALEKGIAKECARFILPLSSETKIYMSGSLRSWIHYFELRCDEHTQQEHREIALEAREIFKEQFPIISEALGYDK
jgi:thymidylate synthase (FAD)